ncbi:MAG: hypothetical protein Greene041662_94, partial [Candidatus Peregrinibacteria bacterium Greene0416_62]
NVIYTLTTRNILAKVTVHAAALESESGATFLGRITIEGDLIINGIPYGAEETIAVSDTDGTQFVHIGTGGVVDIDSLTIKDALYVLGDVTIEGFAQFLGSAEVHGTLTVSGTLILSNNQAGFALIPKGGTGVSVPFDPPMIERPVVTLSSDNFTAHRLRAVTATGFSIEIQTPALESIIFTWHALLTKDPRTVEGSAPDTIRKIPFPVDARGFPLSSNDVWNSCIRNEVQLDPEGQPFSCSRYHVDYIWTHPDLLIEFLMRPDLDPMLILPEGFSPEIQSDEGSIVEQPVDTFESFPAEPIGGTEQEISEAEILEDLTEDGDAVETQGESTETREGSEDVAADPVKIPDTEAPLDSVAEESVSPAPEIVPTEESTSGDTEVPIAPLEQIPAVEVQELPLPVTE